MGQSWSEELVEESGRVLRLNGAIPEYAQEQLDVLDKVRTMYTNPEVTANFLGHDYAFKYLLQGTHYIFYSKAAVQR